MKSVKSLVMALLVPSTLSQHRMTMLTMVTMMTMVPSSLSQYKIVRHNPFASLTPTLAEYTVEGEDGEAEAERRRPPPAKRTSTPRWTPT